MGTILKKDYDWRVASALAEEDLAVKVEYLSKALAMNVLRVYRKSLGKVFNFHRPVLFGERRGETASSHSPS